MESNNTDKLSWTGTHSRKDFLTKIEAEIQQYWERKNIFDVDATTADNSARNKYYITIPPVIAKQPTYSELTLFRAEFIASYQRLRGKNVLFTFGFNKAGIAPWFENYLQWRSQQNQSTVEDSDETTTTGLKIKSKLKAEKFNDFKWIPATLKSYGLSDEEILTLTEERLTEVIVERCKKHIRALGLKVDLRRSFYSWSEHYASFLNWQFTKLRLHNLLLLRTSYGRYSVNQRYFLTSEQDLRTGEGTMPTKYAAIKQLLVEPYPLIIKEYEGQFPIYLLTSHSRAGIAVYGQTNIFVLPEDEYGLYEFKNNMLLKVCQAGDIERNTNFIADLAHQGWSTEHGVVKCLKSFNGAQLIGAKAETIFSNHKQVYVWPAVQNDAWKWVHTGLLISCPSINYADCYSWKYVREIEEFRKQYGLDNSQVLPFEALDLATTHKGLLRDMNLNALKKVISQSYRYCIDIFIEGDYTPLVDIEGFRPNDYAFLKKKEEEMLNSGLAIEYHSTEREVVLRTGEKIIVSSTPVNLINYRDEGWLTRAGLCMDKIHLGKNERNLLESAWYNTTEFEFFRHRLFDSLALNEANKIDLTPSSTLCSAFSAISHILFRCNIDPKDLTYDVYEYIFGSTENVSSTSITKEVLDELRKEFKYWMPVDVEVLTNSNIRTVGLYTIFDSIELLGEEYYPRSYYEAPYKFEGMYRDLDQRPHVFLQNYPADVVRLVLSGTTEQGKATCEQSDCDTGVLQLTREFAWIQQVYGSEQLTDNEDSTEFAELLFAAQINKAIIGATEAWESNRTDIGVKEGFYQLMNYRNNYRSFCESAGRPMNKTLIHRYVRMLLIMLSPICPHITEYAWLNIVKEEESILRAKWPEAEPVDEEVLLIDQYLTSLVSAAHARKKVFYQKQVPKKHPGILENAFILVTNQYQGICADVLKAYYDYITEYPHEFPLEERDAINKLVSSYPNLSSQKGKAVQFLLRLKGRITWSQGSSLMITEEYQFNEKNVLETYKKYLAAKFGVKQVTILEYTPEYSYEGIAQPYAPAIIFNDISSPKQQEQ